MDIDCRFDVNQSAGCAFVETGRLDVIGGSCKIDNVWIQPPLEGF